MTEPTLALIDAEPILQYFSYHHLPPHLQPISQHFSRLAYVIVDTVPPNPQRAVALTKLLEGKDAAVRASLVSQIDAGSPAHLTRPKEPLDVQPSDTRPAEPRPG